MAGMNVWVKNGKTYNLTPDAGVTTAPTTCTRIYKDAPKATIQASGSTTAGSGSATIVIEVSNDDTNWITAGTITLTLGTTSTTDGFTTDAPWKYIRARVTALSGTGASVTALMGV